MDEYDAAVVGGGPVGSFVAEQLARNGRSVAVFEEHNAIGEPEHCAGLVTRRVLDITNNSDEGILQNTIRGAIVHGPDGATLTIGGGIVHGHVINRRRFDEHLSKRAQKTGAMLFLGRKAVQAKNTNNHVQLTLQRDTRRELVRSKLLIAADGSRSRLRSLFAFPEPKETLNGIGAEIEGANLDPHMVHIFIGQKIAPGFFAWVIPTNAHGTTARIGLCIAKHSHRPLQHYFNILCAHTVLQDTILMKKFGGTLPLGPLKKTAGDHFMLVGDAAAQVKPTSGGGLYTGLLCATYCTAIAEEAFQTQQFDEHFLRRYHMRWTKEIGRELSLGIRFRNIFSQLSDTQLNKYLQKLNKENTIEIINTYGDIDYPSRLALPLLKAQPSLLTLIPRMLRRTIK